MKHALVVMLISLSLCHVSCSSPPKPMAAPKPKEAPTGQLSDDVVPQQYQLALRIDPTQEGFSGRVTIDVKFNKPTRRIWLHGKDLVVSQVELTGHETKVAGVWHPFNDDGLAYIDFPEKILLPKGTLEITYTAPFNKSLRGLYKVTADAVDYVYTQFEPIAARLCFPSFDEPRFKTPFHIEVVAPEGNLVVTTTPHKQREPAKGGTRWVFQTTQKLPTYLIAFAVGPFDVVEVESIPPRGPRQQAIPFRGIAPKGKGTQMQYALRHTPALLHILEDYFGRGYPYKKLDIIAVPDFASGAMENVGAITFRDTLLLLDAERAPVSQKRWFAAVMAHELAHQWFGNLVTMQWWDDLWLNEAFATWMAIKTVQAWRPEYGAQRDLVRRSLHAMHTDSKVAARQIRQPITATGDILNAFDHITYSKGGAVLSMFESYLGEETFRKGVRQYLNASAHGSASVKDFVAALASTSDRDVTKPFLSFLEQPGVPLVNVAVSCEDDQGHVRLEQQRYLPLGTEGDGAQTWQVPFCYRAGFKKEAVQACELLTEKQQSFALEKGCPDWLMPNAEAAGYYRFQLDEQSQKMLTQVAEKELSVPEQLAYQDSVVAAMDAGHLSFADAMRQLEPFASSRHRRVATGPMELIRLAKERLVDESKKDNLFRYGRRLYRKPLKRLGYAPKPGESEEDSMFRQELLRFMALVVEDPTTQRMLLSRNKEIWVPETKTVNPAAVDLNIRSLVLALLVQEKGQEAFDALTAQLEKSTDGLWRRDIVYALGLAEAPELAEKARALVLSEHLRSNEIRPLLQTHLWRPAHREQGWEWFKNHFGAVVERVSEFRAGRLPGLAKTFCSKKAQEDAKAFFTPRLGKLVGAKRNLDEALESLALCATKVQTHRESANQFFARRR